MPYKNREEALAASRRSFHKTQKDPVRRASRNTRINQNMKRLYASDPKMRARVAAKSTMWARNNRDWAAFTNTLNRHGLTLDQYHALQERDDFCCAICHEDKPTHVDHDHQTGKRRGLLCRECNTAFGMFKEAVEVLMSAIQYAETRT